MASFDLSAESMEAAFEQGVINEDAKNFLGGEARKYWKVQKFWGVAGGREDGDREREGEKEKISIRELFSFQLP